MAGVLLESVTHEFVRTVGHALGHKFKPYGIIKARNVLNKAGSYLVAVDIVLDLKDAATGAEAKKAKAFRANCLRKEQATHRQIRLWLWTVFRGKDAEPGVGRALRDFRRQLRKWAAEWRAQAEEFRVHRDYLERTFKSLESAMNRGQRLLATRDAGAAEGRNER